MSLLDMVKDLMSGGSEVQNKKSAMLYRYIDWLKYGELEKLLNASTFSSLELVDAQKYAFSIYSKIQTRPHKTVGFQNRISEIIFLLHKKRLNNQPDFFVAKSLIEGCLQQRCGQHPLLSYCIQKLGVSGLVQLNRDTNSPVETLFALYSKAQITALTADDNNEKNASLDELKIHVLNESFRLNNIETKTEADTRKISALQNAVTSTSATMINALKLHRSESFFTWFYNPNSYSCLPTNLKEKYNGKEESSGLLNRLKRFFCFR